MKLGVVGPQEDKWTEETKDKAIIEINRIFYDNADTVYDKYGCLEFNFDNITLVSGGCPKGGIDIWAEEVADQLKIKKNIIKPEINQWDDSWDVCGCGDATHDKKLMGYKSRNIKIAEECNILYCIVPYVDGSKCNHHKGEQDEIDHPNNGGCWTRQYARKIGKETRLVII